jgi:hypothetical protein
MVRTAARERLGGDRREDEGEGAGPGDHRRRQPLQPAHRRVACTNSTHVHAASEAVADEAEVKARLRIR